MPKRPFTENDCKTIVQRLFADFTDTVLRAALIEIVSYKVFVASVEKAALIDTGTLSVLREQARQSPEIEQYVAKQIEPILQLLRSLDPAQDWEPIFEAIARTFGGTNPAN